MKKVLINYIRHPTGKKEINKYSTMELYSSDNSIWEIVEVGDSVEPLKLQFDEEGNLVDDIEKANLHNKLVELAEVLMDKEFDELVKEFKNEDI